MLKDVSSLSKDELMEFVNQTISQGRIAKPEDWIRSWLACHNVQYSYDGMFQVDGIPCALDSLLSYIYVDKVNSDIKKVPKAFIEPAIHKWQEEQRRIYIDQIKSKIIFSGENNLSNSWVKAVTGQENPLDEAVIKHFIWQIKRKLAGLPVANHLMPILVGKTGGGKSEAVKKLLTPLGDLCSTDDLSIVNDSREAFKFTKRYVIFFDELARAQKTDVDRLKHIVTTPTINYRKLGTNSDITGANISTFIGASNNDVRDMIKDPTSARRYYQLNCQDRLNWDVINTIDYFLLFQSIDEQQQSPITLFLDNLRYSQENIRHLDWVEEWLITHKLLPGESDEVRWVKPKSCYEHYMEWLESQNKGQYGDSENSFYRKMAKLVGSHKHSNGSRYYELSEKPLIDDALDIQEILEK